MCVLFLEQYQNETLNNYNNFHQDEAKEKRDLNSYEALAKHFNVTSPDTEFVLLFDRLRPVVGSYIRRYQQVYQGINVDGALSNIYFEENNMTVRYIAGKYVHKLQEVIGEEITPSLTADEKKQLFRSQLTSEFELLESAELVIYTAGLSQDGKPLKAHLAWKIRTSNKIVYLDSKTGDLLSQSKRFQTAGIKGPLLRKHKQHNNSV